MNFIKPALVLALFATSGCELFQTQETYDPVTGELVVVEPVEPIPAREPRGSRGGRGGSGGGGWGS